MKLEKKTLIQYIVLVLLVLGVLYYFFFYSPTQKRIAALEEEEAMLQNELEEKRMRLLREKPLVEQVMASQENIDKMSERMFVDVEQEEALKIANVLNEKGKLVFDSVSLSESYDEQTGIKVVSQQLNFNAGYYDLMEYLRSIRKYDKNIAITGARLNNQKYSSLQNIEEIEEAVREEIEAYGYWEGSDQEGEGEDSEEAGEDKSKDKASSGKLDDEEAVLDVVLSLSYRSLPALGAPDLDKKDKELLTAVKSKRDLAKGPFSRYDEYMVALRRRVEEEAASRLRPSSSSVTELVMPSTVDYETYRPRSMVIDFEDGAFYFVGSNVNMSGSVVRSKVRQSGGFSADMDFNFLQAREYNCANLVLEGDYMLNVQPEYLVMQVYAFEASNHAIGIVLLDSSGKEYRVTLAQKVDWTEWKELSVKLPEGISYPCKIQRIFVEGIGYEQKINGRYLFDMLEAEYAIPGNSDN